MMVIFSYSYNVYKYQPIFKLVFEAAMKAIRGSVDNIKK